RVGAGDAHAGLAGEYTDVALQVAPATIPPFGKTCRNDDSRACLLTGALLQCRHHLVIRHNDADHVWAFGDICQTRVRLEPHDLFVARVHWIGPNTVPPLHGPRQKTPA